MEHFEHANEFDNYGVIAELIAIKIEAISEFNWKYYLDQKENHERT